MLSAIGQIAINVRDLTRATAFYRDSLGLKFLFTTGNLAFFDCNGVRLMLDQIEPVQASILYFKTADIQAEVDQLTARGVTFEQKPHMIAKMPDHELWMAFFRDSEGHLMALMSEVR
jgi:methylmalonyl-CoA/ethylmalonyl-CoA epimerase